MSHGDADSPRGETDVLWTIVVAGGSGLRFGGRKQFADLGGRSVLQRSIDAAASVSTGIVVVVPDDVIEQVRGDAMTPRDCSLLVVAGGTTRAESVRAGLTAVPATAAHILVHDAARPLASPRLFATVQAALASGAAAVVPVVGVTDTIRHRNGGLVDRDELLAVQTPQGFCANALREAHAGGDEATDDASLVAAQGRDITLVDGEVHNRKLTDPIDLVTASAVIGHIQERS